MKARIGLLVLAAVAIAGCSGTAEITLVDAETASDLIATNSELVVLDIRTPEEVAEGTLPRAETLDFYSPSFADDLADLDPDASYLVYCRSGNRSAQATELMADLGFTDVAELDGGVLAWTNTGYELTGN